MRCGATFEADCVVRDCAAAVCLKVAPRPPKVVPDMGGDDLESWSDAALAEAIIASQTMSPAHEAELARRFTPRIRLYGLRHLRGDAEAEDLVQRVLLLTLEKLRAGEVREPAKIGSFVLGTARTLARTAYRGERLVLTETLPEAAHVVAAREPDPHLRGRLAQCFEALSERERSLMVLSFVSEQSADDIGRALGMQPTHVRVTRHRALAKLRACLECAGETTR